MTRDCRSTPWPRFSIGCPSDRSLYTVPTYQNPMGVTMSCSRRQALVDLMREREIVIVEDDPYGELSFDGQPQPLLKALDPEVIFLGFSKILAPGSGWLGGVLSRCGKASSTSKRERTSITSG